MQSTIERLSREAFEQVEKEVGALIGTELEFSLLSASLIKKQDFLENQRGRNSIIGLLMSGRYEGEGCLIVAEDCAVRLAGKMLMLPSTELNDIIKAGNYACEEEISYAFDEIAKCLVISFLNSFQGGSSFIATIACQSQKFAEGRQEMAKILSHLSHDQTYYQVSGTATVAGVTTNTLSLLLPAFVPVCSEPFKKHTGTQSTPASEIENQEQAVTILDNFPENIAETADDIFLPHLGPVLQEELSNLLGSTVQVRRKGGFSGPISELPFGTGTRSHLRTRISISGAARNHGWLVAEIRDAMKLGLLLTDTAPGVMPPETLASGFNVDCQDGYREICSIFIDVINHLCDDLFEGELFMVKDAVSEEAGVESEMDDQGLAGSEQIYLQTSLELVADTLACGTMHILLPVDLYENLNMVEPVPLLETGAGYEQEAIDEDQPIGSPSARSPAAQFYQAAVVLLIEESTAHTSGILQSLEKAGIKREGISLADDVSQKDLDSYLAVLLVLEKLDEIGLGAVIKIKASSSVPLLVAAPLWTQTDVMKALRYGVDDIIMLPAESDELLHKLRAREPLSVRE